MVIGDIIGCVFGIFMLGILIGFKLFEMLQQRNKTKLETDFGNDKSVTATLKVPKQPLNPEESQSLRVVHIALTQYIANKYQIDFPEIKACQPEKTN